MQKDFVSSINAYALVLVLLATVTYAGYLQPPGGSPKPSAPAAASTSTCSTNCTNRTYLIEREEMTVFVVFNSLSFFFAMSDLLLCVISSLSPLRSVGPYGWKEDTVLFASEDDMNLQSEQQTSKLLAHYVSSTLVKLIFVNAIFAFSLTCCVVAFGAAGVVVVKKDMEKPSSQYLAVLGTSIAGGSLFAVFMIWLLIYTSRCIKRAVRDESLGTSLQTRAGSLQFQYRYLNARETR